GFGGPRRSIGTRNVPPTDDMASGVLGPNVTASPMTQSMHLNPGLNALPPHALGAGFGRPNAGMMTPAPSLPAQPLQPAPVNVAPPQPAAAAPSAASARGPFRPGFF